MGEKGPLNDEFLQLPERDLEIFHQNVNIILFRRLCQLTQVGLVACLTPCVGHNTVHQASTHSLPSSFMQQIFRCWESNYEKVGHSPCSLQAEAAAWLGNLLPVKPCGVRGVPPSQPWDSCSSLPVVKSQASHTERPWFDLLWIHGKACLQCQKYIVQVSRHQSVHKGHDIKMHVLKMFIYPGTQRRKRKRSNVFAVLVKLTTCTFIILSTNGALSPHCEPVTVQVTGDMRNIPAPWSMCLVGGAIPETR